MKKTLTCIFALVAIMPAAFADTGAISRALPASVSGASTSSNVTGRTTDTQNAAPQLQSRGAASRTIMTEAAENTNTARTASRTVSAVAASRTTGGVGATTRTGQAVTGGENSDTTARRTVNVSRGPQSRSAANGDMSARSNLDAAVHTVGRNARVSAASINNDPALRRAGVTLRPSTAEVGGRAKISGTDIQTGSNIGNSVRAVHSRAASDAKTTTRETIAEAKERLEQTAELNKSCQEQYNDCMDQFCAVIDANQKRCSCSSNLSRYTKVEAAVKDANNQLNDVAQRIRYVGLSADEIRAIMSATEAEEALSGATDTTETRNMLDDIEELIRNPSSSASSGTDTYTSTLDLNLDFSDTSNMFSLDFLNSNTGSLSNMRGADLYNAAKKRCNTILTQCKDAGATQQQITANYDLAIDKDCIAYEQGLSKMNDTLVSNVRSANLMLQKARLAVLQNKNQYDAKGCIGALDTCMKDEMVCGENYTKCLDPTKKYIDENGEVVLGGDVTKIRNFMTDYDNSTITEDFLQSSYNANIGDGCSTGVDGKGSGDGHCVVKYLLQKIGMGARATEGGLCRAVLDKCQRYTYDDNGNYNKYNDIVINYIQRAMVNIKSGQEKSISDYASNCMLDVATCYNQQVTQVSAWSQSASAANIEQVMRGACRNVALTCGYAIFDGCSFCGSGTGADVLLCHTNCPGEVIKRVSQMFYQSMLCPDNSTWQEDNGTVSTNGEPAGWVNTKCKCNDGYSVWGGACVVDCGTNEVRNTYGTCVEKKQNDTQS